MCQYCGATLGGKSEHNSQTRGLPGAGALLLEFEVDMMVH